MSLAAELGWEEFRQEEVRLKGCFSENRRSGGVREREQRQTPPAEARSSHVCLWTEEPCLPRGVGDMGEGVC